jgi:hypothetical protein
MSDFLFRIRQPGVIGAAPDDPVNGSIHHAGRRGATMTTW